VVTNGGRVVVVEAVVPAGNEPHPSKTSDLLLLALGGGQERTEKEFRELFERSGLKLNRIIPTPSIMLIVEGECALEKQR
jgi:O-methyltransferase domain